MLLSFMVFLVYYVPGNLALTKDMLQIFTKNHFLFKQKSCKLMQLLHIGRQNILSPLVLLLDDSLYLFINDLGSHLAIRLTKGIITLSGRIIVAQVSYFRAHTKERNHCRSLTCNFFKIIQRTC